MSFTRNLQEGCLDAQLPSEDAVTARALRTSPRRIRSAMNVNWTVSVVLAQNHSDSSYLTERHVGANWLVSGSAERLGVMSKVWI